MSQPQTLSSEEIYHGKTFNVRIDDVSEDDLTYKREIVVHRGSAVIVPLFDDGTLALVRQWRHPAGKFLLEIPAGSLEEGEDPRTGALRELEEEIGVRASRLELISEFYVSPGFLTEKMYVFLATGLSQVGQKLDEDERIELQRLSFPDALDRIYNGKIEDAKTIVGVMIASRRLSEPKNN